MITTTKDTFSFSRLLMVLRHDIEQDWKDLSFKTLAVLGLLAGGLLIGLFMGHPFGCKCSTGFSRGLCLSLS